MCLLTKLFWFSTSSASGGLRSNNIFSPNARTIFFLWPRSNNILPLASLKQYSSSEVEKKYFVGSRLPSVARTILDILRARPKAESRRNTYQLPFIVNSPMSTVSPWSAVTFIIIVT